MLLRLHWKLVVQLSKDQKKETCIRIENISELEIIKDINHTSLEVIFFHLENLCIGIYSNCSKAVSLITFISTHCSTESRW